MKKLKRIKISENASLMSTYDMSHIMGGGLQAIDCYLLSEERCRTQIDKCTVNGVPGYCGWTEKEWNNEQRKYIYIRKCTCAGATLGTE